MTRKIMHVPINPLPSQHYTQMTESKSSSKCHAGKGTSELLFPPPLETQLHCESSPFVPYTISLAVTVLRGQSWGEYSFFLNLSRVILS